MEIDRLDTKEEIDNFNISDSSFVVVIDTCMFSSSVISILDRGVSKVNVFKNYFETNYPFGGEGEGNYEFGNFPQSVYGFDFNHNCVGFTSDNGAVACHKVKENNDSSRIVIASSINMKAVSEYLEEEGAENIVIVQSGSHNKFQLEDSITSGLLSQHIRKQEHPQINLFQKQLKGFVQDYYSWVPDEDLKRLSDFSSYNIVPVNEDSSENYISFEDAKK